MKSESLKYHIIVDAMISVIAMVTATAAGGSSTNNLIVVLARQCYDFS